MPVYTVELTTEAHGVIAALVDPDVPSGRVYATPEVWAEIEAAFPPRDGVDHVYTGDEVDGMDGGMGFDPDAYLTKHDEDGPHHMDDPRSHG